MRWQVRSCTQPRRARMKNWWAWISRSCRPSWVSPRRQWCWGQWCCCFALFAVVQFQYFFGGQTNIGVQGYTYAEYARRGFGELVTVAFFSLLLFLSLSAVVKRQNQTQRWVFSGLGLGMVALVGVMLSLGFPALGALRSRVWLLAPAGLHTRLL